MKTSRRNFFKSAALLTAAIYLGRIPTPALPTVAYIPSAQAYLQAWSDDFRNQYRSGVDKTLNRFTRITKLLTIRPKILHSKKFALDSL